MLNIHANFFNKNLFPILVFPILHTAKGIKICKIINVNDAAVHFTGYSAKELLKMRATDLEAKGQGEPLETVLERCGNDFHATNYRRILVRKDGEEMETITTAKAVDKNRKHMVFLQIIPFFLIKGLFDANVKRIMELELELKGVNSFKGCRTVCLECRKIKTDSDKWVRYEQYFSQNSPMIFSHGVCPECGPKYLSKLKSRH